jgi:hypothetical protein
MNRYVPLFRPAVRGADAPRPAASATLAEARIALALSGNRFLLDDGRLARQALSCVIAPEPGDCVLAGGGAGGEVFVLHLLHRADPALAELSVPGAVELRIHQARLALYGHDEVALRSPGKVELSAAGLLSLQAENIYSTASEALVQSMRHYAGNAEQYLLDVGELLRMHAGHAILHAEQDVKLDGERITVG